MSLSIALNSAIAGLRINKAGTEVASANIANAHDPSYTRKTLVTSTFVGRNSSSPTLEGIERRVADSLQQDYRGLLSARGGAELRNGYAQQIGHSLDLESNEPRLSRMESELETAFRDLEGTPESEALAWQVIEKADGLAQEIRKVAVDLEKLEKEARHDMDLAVDDLNEQLGEIAKLNQEIRDRSGSDQPIGDLEDRRDAAIDRVAELVDVTVLDQGNGSVSLYTKTGQMLVGLSATSFEWDGDDLLNKDGDVVNTALKGGKIGALTDLLADDAASMNHPDSGVGTLAKLKDQIDTLAQEMSDRINAAYDGAATEPGELATDFFVTGTPPGATIEVNPDLLDGTARVKGAAGTAVSDALLNDRFNVTAGGLSLTDTSVGGFVDSILSRSAGHLANQKANASETDESLKAVENKFRGMVGVDIDREIAELMELQNAYAANSRVVTTVNGMMDTLLEMVR